MANQGLTEYFPLLGDLPADYRIYRRKGLSRAAALEQLRADYEAELADEQDGAIVRLGLALALCRRRELTESVRADALEALGEIARWEEVPASSIRNLKTKLQDPAYLGEEAAVRVYKPYLPDWKVGDTFSHLLAHPMAEKVGLSGYCVLFRKAGELIDWAGEHRQLVYVSLCPPGSLPSTTEALRQLGYLRMMERGGGRWDYFAQIKLKSRRDEAGYGLTFLGNFPDVGRPKGQGQENLLTAMPLFGKQHRGDDYPDYEDSICRLYRQNGIQPESEF